jgi:hypothetical protein
MALEVKPEPMVPVPVFKPTRPPALTKVRKRLNNHVVDGNALL